MKRIQEIREIDSYQRQQAIADMRTMIKVMSDDKKITDALDVLTEHDIEFDSIRAEHLVARSSDIYELMVSPRHELRNIIDEANHVAMKKRLTRPVPVRIDKSYD
tara:strand:- start:497 stop:811 length:315 start_codon:yes stop_codon:yes gene_type:complete